MKRYMMCAWVVLLAGMLASCGGGGGDVDSGGPSGGTTATTPAPIPTGPATTLGAWSAPVSLPIVTIHMLALPDGKVLAWSNPRTPPKDGRTPVRLWDPSAAQPVLEEAANPFANLYCSAHLLLPDGRVLTMGGHIRDNIGLDASTTFDPVTRSWTNGARMNAGRWYPTATVLGNGDVLVVSGDIDTTVGVNPLPQVYRPADGT